MKILGISGSPRKETQSGVYKLVQTVLENTGVDFELISLRNKTIVRCCCTWRIRRPTLPGCPPRSLSARARPACTATLR